MHCTLYSINIAAEKKLTKTLYFAYKILNSPPCESIFHIFSSGCFKDPDKEKSFNACTFGSATLKENQIPSFASIVQLNLLIQIHVQKR